MSSLRAYALLVCCLGMVDAGLQVGSLAAFKETAVISPTLRPTSDKKFFDKDYPGDKRPKVDVFHFHHPYPAVQDSGDFDKDFVKDENSDNGYWKAQTEYDRLRNKLQKEKAEVTKALSAKKKAESELKEATQREKEQEEKLKKEEEEQKEEEKEKKAGGMSSSAGESKETVIEERKQRVVPDKRVPGGVTSPGQVKDQSGRVEKQMKKLEDCKEQLAEAREKLKKLMKELEEAREEQEKTQAALDASLKHMEESESKHEVAEAHAKKEYQEYLDAKDAYLKQQTKVAKMEMDIKIAAEKVRKFRDAEDKDGGVYPTADNKSGAASRSLLLAAASVLVWTLQ